jgi:hypothetical protein
VNIDSQILAKVAKELAELDFSPENARIAEIEADIGRMQAAVDVANERREEIGGILRPLLDPRGGSPAYEGHDAVAVANALLADVEPSEAAAFSKSQEELEREREALRLAVVDLAARIRGGYTEITEIQSRSRGRVQHAVQPVIDAIFADAQSATRQIVESFAALQAITTAAKMAGPHFIAMQNALSDGGGGLYRLLAHAPYVDVPTSIVNMLNGLSDKGPALPAVLLSSFSTPSTSTR